MILSLSSVKNFFLPYRTEALVLFLGAILCLAAIVLSNTLVLPLSLGDFFFFSFLFFLFALYRPGWVFALLVAMLPLEIVNLAPESIGFNMRPYQFLAAILGVSIAVRVLARRTSWKLFSFQPIDSVPILFALAGFLTLPFLPESEWLLSSAKQAVIVLSFVFLYFLGRVFLKSYEDVRIAGRFFFVSTVLVLFYSLWQSIRMKFGLSAFEVMAGRPNGTFPEADWLGGFLAAVIAFVSAFVFPFFFSHSIQKWKLAILFSFCSLLFLVLVLSVSRSAWVAAFLGMVFVVFLVFIRRGMWRSLIRHEWDVWRRMALGKLFLFSSLLVALLIAVGFSLTSFHLFDRGKSIGSGLQKITVSCGEERMFLRDVPVDVETLSLLDCRHIDLEAIETERAAGRFIGEAYRSDPNISIRKEIYGKTFSLLAERPVFGIGWGNSSRYFGNDERGAGLNSSNMFLETWLGAGVFGFLSFLFLWCWFGYRVCIEGVFLKKFDGTVLNESFWIGLSGAWIAITVFNFFNAGLLLGSLWIFLSLPWFSRKDP